MDPNGYYEKYTVIDNRTGQKVTDFRFTLLPDSDPHARAALRAYADSVADDNPTLAADLRQYLSTPVQES